MPRLITPKDALINSQPRFNVRINWAHPLARDLKFATILNQPYGHRNLVLNAQGNIQAPARWRGSSRNAVVFWNDEATTVELPFPQSAISIDGWTALSCVIAVFQASTGDDFDAWISSDQYNIGFYLGRNTSQRKQLYIEDQQLLDYGTCYDDDTWVVHGATWSKADTYAAHFVNGIKVADDTDARWNITISYTSKLTIGNAPNSALYGHGDYEYAFLWNRRLSESEMLQMFLDPYGFFIPEKSSARIMPISGAGLSIPVAMNTYRRQRA